jgi:hypothetical protein
MNLFLDQYALLIAVATPVLTLVAMNLLLALGGERGTLLMPSAGTLQAVRRAANRVPTASAAAAADTPANEPDFRRAA